MLVKEFIRFFTQHRTFYCYMILSVWIFLLIAGMYKYIGRNGQYSILNNRHQQANLKSKQWKQQQESQHKQQHRIESSSRVLYSLDSEIESNLEKYQARCTPLTSIQRVNDGGILDGWKMQGVLLIIRHGDRGPMSHVRPIPSLNCGQMDGNYLVNKYRTFLYNSTSTSSANHMYWNKVGSFHGFPLLPMDDTACLLGQLTFKGIGQLLQLGDILRYVYANPLGLWLKHNSNQMGKQQQAVNLTLYSQMLSSDEIVVYTTRVRRTFQSALAFLYTFLPSDKWSSLNIRESHSIAFCFSDCACPHADILRKHLKELQKQQLINNRIVVNVMHWIGYNLLSYKSISTETTPSTNDLTTDHHEVIDAMLMVLCHNAKWPCHRNINNTYMNGDSEEVILSTTTVAPTSDIQENEVDLNDIINIDQNDEQIEDDMQNIKQSATTRKVISSEETIATKMTTTTMGCIQSSQVAELMSFALWQSKQAAHHTFYKSAGLLRAYGMIRHIVSYMLRMISGDRTKFVLYSGHDWTLQFLTAALGIHTVDNTFIPYAARLAIEVYKSETHIDYYFRVVYNGRDVTEQIDFCEGGKSLRITRDSRGTKADLCPIENIIRFLHDDYFTILNVTNFKDACIVPQTFINKT